MPKKTTTNGNIQKLDVISSSYLDTLKVMSCNVTFKSRESFNTIKDILFPDETSLTSVKYGSGPLAYSGKGNADETLLFGTSKDGSSYLIRSVGDKDTAKLIRVLRTESSAVLEAKISSSEAIVGISLDDYSTQNNLLIEALKVGSKSSRMKISSTSDKVLQLGSTSSSKFIQVYRSKDDRRPSNVCLAIFMRFKENEAKFFKLADERNLTLEDFHALALRDVIDNLNDCDLKDMLLRFIGQTFTIPNKDKIKQSKQVANPKLKYIQSAFKTAMKYLDITELRTETINLITNFIQQFNEFRSQQPVTSSKKKKDET